MAINPIGTRVKRYLSAAYYAWRFSLFWLLFMIFFYQVLPTMLKLWSAIAHEGLFSVAKEEDGPRALLMFVALLFVGTLSWLMSKVEERRFIEAITKK